MPIAKKLNTILKNAMDNLTPVTKEDTTGTVVLADEYPNEIQKSIANKRFIYNNDATIRGLILNNTFTANSSFQITIREGYEDVPNIEEARKYIEDRCKPNDWDLHTIIEQTLIKAQRDGQCFIGVPIVQNQTHLFPLTYDGEEYDFMMIPDTEIGKVVGYVQKHPELGDFGNWQSMEWDDLVKASEEIGDTTTTPFLLEEIIHFKLFGEDGEASGLMDAIMEKVPDKWKYEGYMLSVSQKTGAIAIVKIGNAEHKNDSIKNSFISKILGVFNGRINKTAVAVPDGVEVDQMNNSSLPDIPSYRRTIIQEIYVALQTPRSMFNTKETSYASGEVATDTETGYGVFLNKLRTTIKNAYEVKLFDRDLAIQSGFADCVGGIEITYTKDVSKEEPLEPTNEDLSVSNPDLEKTAKNQEEEKNKEDNTDSNNDAGANNNE